MSSVTTPVNPSIRPSPKERTCWNPFPLLLRARDQMNEFVESAAHRGKSSVVARDVEQRDLPGHFVRDAKHISAALLREVFGIQKLEFVRRRVLHRDGNVVPQEWLPQGGSGQHGTDVAEVVLVPGDSLCRGREFSAHRVTSRSGRSRERAASLRTSGGTVKPEQHRAL